MESLKLKILPAFVFALFAAGMYLLDKVLPFGEFDFFGRQLLIYILAGIGLFIALVAIFQFSRQGTTLDPRQPEKATKLVTGGLYQYSRNPMYLALLLVLLAWGLRLGNAFNTLLAAGFVWYMNRFQILPEEEVLHRKFGAAFRQYCTLVRRWF